MSNFAPIIPPKHAEHWVYEAFRSISAQLGQHALDLSAVGRGEAPDGSGNALIDTSRFFVKPGLSGGQIAFGGVNANDNLWLSSTTAADKGFIYFGYPTVGAAFDEDQKFFGVGTSAPTARFHAHLASTGTSGVNQLGTHFAEYSVDVSGSLKNILALAAYSNNGSSYDVAFISGGSNPLNGIGSIYFTNFNATGASGTGLRFAYGTYSGGTVNFMHMQIGGLDDAGVSKNRNLLICGFNDNCGSKFEAHFNHYYIESEGALSDSVARVGINFDPATLTGTTAGAQPVLNVAAMPSIADEFEVALRLNTNIAHTGTEGVAPKVEIFQTRIGLTGSRTFAIDRWGRLCLYNPGNGALTSRITARFSDLAIESGALAAATPTINFQLINTNSWSDGAAIGVYQMRLGFLQTAVRWSIITGDNQAGSGNPNPLDRLGLNATRVFICNASVATGGSFTPPTAILHIKNTVATTEVLFKMQRIASQSANLTEWLQENGTTVMAFVDKDGNASFSSISSAYVAKTGTYTIVGTDSVIDCTSGTFTVTLPTAVGITGKQFTIKNSGSGIITVATTSSQTIDGGTTAVMNVQYLSITVVSDGANWKII
jgi:hypothetical protein